MLTILRCSPNMARQLARGGPLLARKSLRDCAATPGFASSSIPHLQVLVSTTTNPFFNLATEEWLFRNGDISGHTLFLWRNEPTVVIGRCQNPWKECNLQAMQEKGVHMARRSSGGGAVYQDLGNTNFTFLSSTDNFDKHRNSGIIIEALKKWGLKASTSGRNDIVVGSADEPLKISGAAYKLAPPRALHHGTLLIGVDMTALSSLLNPSKLKLQSKGVASVASRVTNLQTLSKDITHESLSAAVIDAFCQHHRGTDVTVQELDHAFLQEQATLKATYDSISDEKWRFGETPEFSHHIEGRFESPSPWGTIDVHIDSRKGIITEVKVFSDSLYPVLIDSLAAALTSKPYDSTGIDAAMAELAVDSSLAAEIADLPQHLTPFATWLKASL
jgi:lipoate-protein ligase A